MGWMGWGFTNGELSGFRGGNGGGGVDYMDVVLSLLGRNGFMSGGSGKESVLNYFYWTNLLLMSTQSISFCQCRIVRINCISIICGC